MNPFLATDGYKTGHHLMYPEGTTMVYSNFTPRSNKHAPMKIDHVVSFGQQMTMILIHEMFNKDFFDRPKHDVCNEIKEEYSLYLDVNYDVAHIEALHDLGYLPIKVKALTEGTLVPMGVPLLTIKNTEPEFYWLTNFLETLISNLLWKPITSATIAREYKNILLEYAYKTDKESIGFVDFQGHDFSMRGLSGIDSVIQSGLGHATSFSGSDSLPVIHGARHYYGETGFVVGSVNATEHSVMCAGNKEDEVQTFRNLMKTFPTGILSVVSDTWDLWKVLTDYLPILKDEILARDGKLVIRPDSGDPVDIICGYPEYDGDGEDDANPNEEFLMENEFFSKDGKLYQSDQYGIESLREEDGSRHGLWEVMGSLSECSWEIPNKEAEAKGVIELLWDIFGGTTNEQGYKVLDSHIGAIYGDSITLDRAKAICERLEAKGFASTNVVLGIGSFTYQFNTRDTFGFAMKATYVELEETFYATDESVEPGIRTVGREIFKDPVTDDGVKKSAKGLLSVRTDNYISNDSSFRPPYVLYDQCSWEEEDKGELKTIYNDGTFINYTNLTEIRKILNEKSYAI